MNLRKKLLLLGTIAKSGTKEFMEALQEGADVNMIGQNLCNSELDTANHLFHVIYARLFQKTGNISSLSMSDSNGNNLTNVLSVSLAGTDGRVLGGRVAGVLLAATPVQVIVGSFIADGKKPKSGLSPAPPPHMLNFGAEVPGVSPSEGGSSESSDEIDSSPLNQGPGSYSNARLANPSHQCMPMQGLTLCLLRADSLHVLEVDMQVLEIK